MPAYWSSRVCSNYTARPLVHIILFNSTKRQNFRLVQIETFADDKIIVILEMKFVLGRQQNIVGKGENAGPLFRARKLFEEKQQHTYSNKQTRLPEIDRI